MHGISQTLDDAEVRESGYRWLDERQADFDALLVAYNERPPQPGR